MLDGEICCLEPEFPHAGQLAGMLAAVRRRDDNSHGRCRISVGHSLWSESEIGGR